MSPHPYLADEDATALIPAVPDPQDDAATPEDSSGTPKSHRRRRTRRRLLIAGLVVLLLAGVGLVSGGLYLRSVESDIKRVDAFADVPEADRPAKEAAAGNALNFLVLGSDSRDPNSPGGSRSDTIILLHLPKDRSGAQMVSIPRDTWVPIPRSKDGKHGGVEKKINASFAWGGVPLMVQTVEKFTGVRIDHVAMIDFAGFKEIVDALGGVEIDVEESFTSTHSLNPNGIREFKKGVQTMDGAAALDYARERFAFKDGDFARIRHQQQVIRAILNKASTGGILANPVKLNQFVNATTSAVTVDGTLNLVDMAMELRHLRSENLAFYTSPNQGTGTRGTESVVVPDTARAKALFDAIRKDDTATAAKLGSAK